MPGDLLAGQAVETHHWLPAHATAVQTHRRLGLPGDVGITLSICSAYPATDTDADRAAAHIEDGLHNRWFLDAVLRGTYPDDTLAPYTARRCALCRATAPGIGGRAVHPCARRSARNCGRGGLELRRIRQHLLVSRSHRLR